MRWNLSNKIAPFGPCAPVATRNGFHMSITARRIRALFFLPATTIKQPALASSPQPPPAVASEPLLNADREVHSNADCPSAAIFSIVTLWAHDLAKSQRLKPRT